MYEIRIYVTPFSMAKLEATKGIVLLEMAAIGVKPTDEQLGLVAVAI